MKNKDFKKLSMYKKEKRLLYALRNKTNGLLNVNEEVVLLSAGMKRKQFCISVYNDITLFARTLDNTESLDYEIIFGEDAVRELGVNNTLVNGSIAVFASIVVNNRAVQQLLIYIPESRHHKRGNFCEKNNGEKTQSYDVNTLCCDLQPVQA